MRVLIRMPNLLGDAVMATPAVDNLMRHYPAAGVVLVGSAGVCRLFADDPRFLAVITDGTRSERFRTAALWRLGRQLRASHGPFDLAVTFPNSLSSRLFLFSSGARHRVGRRQGIADWLMTHAIACEEPLHEAERFNRLVNQYLSADLATGPARLHVAQGRTFAKPTIGINPGAAHGPARRWHPRKFAATAVELAADFDIVIFGGPDELESAGEVESALRDAGRSNYCNIAGCTMAELIAWLSGLDLLITNDTGPMHMAGALGVPIVALFGPTDPRRTRPWSHGGLRVLYRHPPCGPCEKAVCPLGHHDCLQQIGVGDVIQAVRSLRDATGAAEAA